MPQAIDLTNQRFGKLVALKKVPSKNHHTYWLCQCDCGNQKIIDGCRLRRGDTKSCGCLSIEQAKINFQKNFYTHRQSKTRLYRIWKGMKNRCYNERTPKYKDYGMRGIRIYEEWQNFEPFYDWAMNNGYQDDLTIDRIDVNGNYEPNNCRWIKSSLQARNRRNNHLLLFNGKTRGISEWAEIYNLKPLTLLARINRGWSIEKALNTKVI